MDDGSTVFLVNNEVTVSAHTHPGDTTEDTTFSKFVPPTNGTLAAGNYVLTGNVKLTTNLTIKAGTADNKTIVNLCLNGFKLTGSTVTPGSVITVGEHAEFHLHDCTAPDTADETKKHPYYIDDTGKFVYKKNASDTAFDQAHADASSDKKGKTIGGVITGGSKTDYGGGVYVSANSAFTMSGGVVSGNHATPNTVYSAGSGGGVYVSESSTFTMSGGVV